MRAHERAVQGVIPKIFHYKTNQQQFAEIERLVESALSADHGVLPRQIVLLSPFVKKKTCLDGIDRIAGLPLVDYANWSKDVGKRVIFYETLQAFKGCEAELVILHDVKGELINTDPMSLYVAASRARFALYVFAEQGFEWPGAEKV
jgi:hypothetical protein